MRNMLAVIMVFCAALAHANEVITAQIKDASVVGSARLSYVFWDVYDATLYAPGGQWNPNQPFALSLHYLLAIDGEDIAERSVEEMRKQGFGDEAKLTQWLAQMREIFPDVQEGTQLTGIYRPAKPTDFYIGATKIGSVADPEFGRHFFDIWLAENSSEPAMRRELLSL